MIQILQLRLLHSLSSAYLLPSRMGMFLMLIQLKNKVKACKMCHTAKTQTSVSVVQALIIPTEHLMPHACLLPLCLLVMVVSYAHRCYGSCN